MQTSCPSCGADIFPGARFCRRCGAPVSLPGGETGDVSPNAATVPLVPDETRPTGGLAPGEEQHVAQQTTRVSLAEMERLLRAQDDGGQQQSQPTAPEARHAPAVTRPDLPGHEDEELTITVPRSAETREPVDFEATLDFDATRPVDPEATIPAGVGSWPYTQTNDAETHDPPAADDNHSNDSHADSTTPPPATDVNSPSDVVVSPGALPPRPGTRPASSRRAWPLVVAVCVAFAVLASGGAWLTYRLLHRPALTDLPTQVPTAPPVSEANAQFEQKLAEAESLLAAGDMQGALARLREANELDPANTRAHRRLGELLLSNGARREAIEEFRALTHNAPDDSGAWRQLALAQLDEGLDRDAVESFRHFVTLMGGESSVDPHDLLVYAGALLSSGRADEALSLFQRLASSPDTSVSSLAQSHLDTLARPQPTPTPAPRTGEPTPAPRGEEIVSVSATPAPQPTPAAPTPQPTPTPAPPAPTSPAERYGRGVHLWATNRGAALEEFRAAAAGGNADAHYYLGLAYVEGRKTSSLQRAEVVAALQHFQLAQRGEHAAQARGYAQQLEKEFDRLRRQ
ncbi:MAG: Tetratricopeptide repeat [Acidobacteriota bacterium]|jgi:tetratricopeptide (TPR) repeat protein|nr:Tetratricopeptide repeat [Acidobacteriota bacterium]